MITQVLRTLLLAGVLKSTNVLAQLEIQKPLGGEGNMTSGCQAACKFLVGTLGEMVYHDQLPVGFTDRLFSSRQQELIPECVVEPISALDVSQVIIAATSYHCIFAVKSGGHAMFGGASNAPQGITIDLFRMTEIKLSEDETTVSIGPGNKWGEVYKALDATNVTIVGGRVASVGVGGFTLGGGISFTSRRYGWALDNVRNYEVVLANGSITNVNYESHADLYFALRGGGNNFGVVTRFDFETFPHEPVWGGMNIYFPDDLEERRTTAAIHSPFQFKVDWLAKFAGKLLYHGARQFGYTATSKSLIKAIEELSLEIEELPSAQYYCSFFYVQKINKYLAVAQLVHKGSNPNPPAFKGFRSIPSLYNTNKVRNMTDIVQEISAQNPPGYRHRWDTLTFKVNAALMSQFIDIFISEIDGVKDKVPLTLSSMVIQTISREEIKHFSKNGGNALGIAEEDGPLILIASTLRWKDPKYDAAMIQASKNINARATAIATEMNVLHRFIYQNYASESEDVFAGYGEVNRLRLREIQMKYDPEGVFSRLQPGYFKV